MDVSETCGLAKALSALPPAIWIVLGVGALGGGCGGGAGLVVCDGGSNGN